MLTTGTRFLVEVPVTWLMWVNAVSHYAVQGMRCGVSSDPTTMVHLLTLDPTTLFYWNLSKMYGPSSEPIDKWASNIPKDARLAGMQTISSVVPSLTHSKTTLSQPSATFRRSALSANVGIRKLDDHENMVGGLSDHDETQGPEWDELQQAPKRMGSVQHVM